MAITVSAKNYTLLNNCNAATGWSGGQAVTSDIEYPFVFGTASVAFTTRTAATQTLQYTASLDFSGTGTNMRIWFLTSTIPDTYANGGIQLFIGDSSNTAYWNVSGSDVYPGGFVLLSCDVSSTPDSGTLPSNRAACTKCGIILKTTGTTKNTPTTFVDHLHKADGLIAYGDDSGGYFGIQQIYDADNTTSTAHGFISKVGGVFYLNGSLTIGDASGSSSTKFNIKSQVIVFQNRKVSSAQYAITVVDNGTGTTEFILGSKSGTSGIEGCIIRNESVTQNAKFSIDAQTDTDVDNFKLYGTTFLGATSLKFPAAATNVEVLNCNFDTCGEVSVNTAIVENCNFISSVSDAVHIASTSHNTDDNKFINCSRAVRFSVANTYTMDGNTFSGNTYDIHFSATTGNLVINATNGADPGTYLNDSTGTVTINNAVSIYFKVTNESGSNIVGARVYLEAAAGGSMTAGDEIINALTDSNGEVSDSFNYSGSQPVAGRIRKSSGEPYYKSYTLSGSIGPNGYTVNAIMILDQ